jgi:hypothetical protein
MRDFISILKLTERVVDRATGHVFPVSYRSLLAMSTLLTDPSTLLTRCINSPHHDLPQGSHSESELLAGVGHVQVSRAETHSGLTDFIASRKSISFCTACWECSIQLLDLKKDTMGEECEVMRGQPCNSQVSGVV